jgi:hypothetical protein
MDKLETQRFIEAESAGHVVGGKRDSADTLDRHGRILSKRTPRPG